MVAIASGDSPTVSATLQATPSLATARLARADEFFINQCRAQVYADDTALHAAAFAYDDVIGRELLALGADVRARNRRGAEPLHAAVMGAPGSVRWNPDRQQRMIKLLIGAGADPNAMAAGGVTPLHRAVRNRCSAAVETLLEAGADRSARNDRGSTPLDTARSTTGRGGVGSEAAKEEQRLIIGLLT
jgi:ankyrin repeat protein